VNKILILIYRIIVPLFIRKRFSTYKKWTILRYLKKNMEDGTEKQKIIDFLKRNPFEAFTFPYDFVDDIRKKHIEVWTDADNGAKYVEHQGKRMYFPMTWDKNQIQDYYIGLLIEQYKDSPHLYETADFCVQNGDTIADIGAAEGIFALSNVEKAKKIFLFECDEQWIEALKRTFEPYKEKVVITNKLVSDKSINEISHNNQGGNQHNRHTYTPPPPTITIDDFLGETEINFIKADIEGMEKQLLLGAKKTLINQKNLKLSICAYHRHNDAKDLKDILTQYGYKTHYSKGYMIASHDILLPPYLRHGIIRAKK
jgi:FkbM family methyltransferase